MAEYLRGDEILTCVHRLALSRGAPVDISEVPPSPEMERRRRVASEHRRSTLELLRDHHPDAPTPHDVHETAALLDAGAELLFLPRLADDVVGRRRTSVHALVRVGRVEERFTYAPLLIKNHEVVEVASTRRTLEGTLDRLRPSDAHFLEGVGTRSAPPMTRTGLALAHATRVLDASGHADASARAAVIDRHQRLWWMELAGTSYPRFNLSAYAPLYDVRRHVLEAHEAWTQGTGPFPTAPYWHRDCPDCPFREHCETQLEERDDVSLTRFTTFDQQLMLREHGVDSRAQLARLDPHLARRSRRRPLNPLEHHEREDVLGHAIDKLDDLIYRARAHERGTALRKVDADKMGCPRADVEVDVDMESYDDATYLWGASVSVHEPTMGVEDGYRSFVNWDTLSRESEARIFQEFWTWLDGLRHACTVHGRTFSAYCFWAHAEDGAMNRAVTPALEGGPTIEDLTQFRRGDLAQWQDVHELAKRQIQTEGPLGLKQLAGAAGFTWRDPNPSGEASMLWYEEATRSDSSTALVHRTRILEYNQDDCRATKALRDWLNGPARGLAHRDDPV